MNYLRSVHQSCCRHSRTLQFWANTFHGDPEQLWNLPPGVIAMEYGHTVCMTVKPFVCQVAIYGNLITRSLQNRHDFFAFSGRAQASARRARSASASHARALLSCVTRACLRQITPPFSETIKERSQCLVIVVSFCCRLSEEVFTVSRRFLLFVASQFWHIP